MRAEKFEDLIAWKEAMRFTKVIYLQFSNIDFYAFKNQILRAVISVSNNIAEGFERETDKEFIRFLYIARASCGEVRNMLYLAQSFDMISEEKREELIGHSKRVSYLILQLIKSMKK